MFKIMLFSQKVARRKYFPLICKKSISKNAMHNKVYEKSMDVPTFCCLKVDLPCNVNVTHLDVHKFTNCDKLFVKLFSSDGNFNIDCHQNENIVEIFGKSTNDSENVLCEIVAPIKANLDLTSSKGDINAGFFTGDSLMIKALNGNVAVDKYQGGKICINTEEGNIFLNGAVQAAHIKLSISKTGTINTNRLQGLSLSAETKFGDIIVHSSYCDDSHFQVTEGKMVLSNVHRNCQVSVAEKGSLKMTGFDGKLQAHILKGNADIQISQILDDSKILIKDQGDLILHVSETCCENASFEIVAKECKVDENLNSILSNVGNTTFLTSLVENAKSCFVDCRKGSVKVKSTSWTEMLFANSKNE